jgi:hypothetical protein
MKEIAFKVKSDSEFYNKYFKAKEERQHFHDLARVFFEKYDLVDNAEYYQTEFLGLKLNAEQKKRFAEQLKKYDDENGMSVFKKKSAMQKVWNEDVTSKVDFETIDAIRFWYFYFINKGKYNLWDDGHGTIYGYLQDDYKEEIGLADYMIEIKMSEYYSVIESLKN